MSIRLDPRRLGALKHLAGEAGVRPGDLVRQWVEERIDASRTGESGSSLGDTVAALVARVAALEASLGVSPPTAEDPAPEPHVAPAETEPVEAPEPGPAVDAASEPEPSAQPEEEPVPAPRRRRSTVSATATDRVALHDEMIAVIRERGPMTASDLAAAVAERGRYAPPRSGKAIDAKMISQRVSNPTYRSRFVRADGRIGLAEEG